MTHSNPNGSRTGTPATRKKPEGYPKRPSFFFHRFTRWLIKLCVANVIGADGCWLLTIIAAFEDSRRYQSPPSFYNSQLAMLCGWSIDKLARVRSTCADAGLMVYRPGGNRKPGIYWVVVDESIGELADSGPIGELAPQFNPQSAEQPADNPATEPPDSRGRSEAQPAEPPYLSPSLNPSPPLLKRQPDSDADARVEAVDWQEVEGALVKTGLADAVGTARDARDRGYSPGQVLELIAEFNRRRADFSSEGALAFRIRKSPASRPIAEGWPGQSASAKAAETTQGDRERSTALRTEIEAHAAKVAAQREDERRLVELLGEKLDDLSPDELEPLLPAGIDRQKQVATLHRDGWRNLSALWRSRLIRAFADQQNETPSADRDRQAFAENVAASVPQNDRRSHEVRTEAV